MLNHDQQQKFGKIQIEIEDKNPNHPNSTPDSESTPKKTKKKFSIIQFDDKAINIDKVVQMEAQVNVRIY